MSGPQLFGVITLSSTVGLLVVCFILYAILQRKRHLRCPKCGTRFKASAASTFFAARDGVDKRMTCPKCGYYGYLADCRDSEAEAEDKARTESETPEESSSASPEDKA